MSTQVTVTESPVAITVDTNTVSVTVQSVQTSVIVATAGAQGPAGPPSTDPIDGGTFN